MGLALCLRVVPGKVGSSFPGQSWRMVGLCPGCECWCKRACMCGEQGHCLGCPAEEGSKERELKVKGLKWDRSGNELLVLRTKLCLSQIHT